MSIISLVSLTHLGSSLFDSLFITTTVLSVAFLQAIVAWHLNSDAYLW